MCAASSDAVSVIVSGLWEYVAAYDGTLFWVDRMTRRIRTRIGIVEEYLADYTRREAAERAERDAARASREPNPPTSRAAQTPLREPTSDPGPSVQPMPRGPAQSTAG